MKIRTTAAALAVFFALAGLAAAPLLADSPATAASPAATAAPTAAPSASPEINARAKEWLGRIQSGKIDRTQLTKTMSDQLTDAMVTSVANQVGPLGPATKLELVQVLHQGGNTAYVYNATFAGDSSWLFAFVLDDASSKISGLRIKPAQ
jgi:hypothetical protein